MSELSVNKFNCQQCNYSTYDKKDYNKHLATLKHKNNILATQMPKKYICEICNKNYIDRTGLWRHKKKCSPTPTPTDIALSLVNQNKELINIFIEDRKLFMEEMKGLLDSQRIT